jgi:hypothetical protein
MQLLYWNNDDETRHVFTGHDIYSNLAQTWRALFVFLMCSGC